MAVIDGQRSPAVTGRALPNGDRADPRVVEACDFMHQIRMRPATMRTRAELIREDALLRQHLDAVLDVVTGRRPL